MNGIDEIDTDDLSADEKLDLIIEALIDVQAQQIEIIEKLSNISLPGSYYGIEN